MTTVVIDCDLIAFKAAAACESRYINVKHWESGREKQFKHRTEFKAWLKENPKWSEEDFLISDERTAEPIENCLYTVKAMVKGIKQQTKATEAEFYISGKDNFRLNLPLPYQYKGERDSTLKPLHLDEARRYMIQRFNAVPVDGVEADDTIARRAYAGFKTGQKIIAATIDKDQMGTEGWVFNWDKMTEPEMVEGLGYLERTPQGVKGRGFLWRAYQVSFGDSTDGYCPLDLYKLECEKNGVKPKKCGEVYFFNMLKDCQSIPEAVKKVFDFYQEFYPEPVTYTDWSGKEHTKDWKQIMEMYIHCAVMRDGSNWHMLKKWEDAYALLD